MNRLLVICLLALVGCADPSGAIHTEGLVQTEPTQQEVAEQGPIELVDFYPTTQPPIDFTTFVPRGKNVSFTYWNYFNANDELNLTPDIAQIKNYKVIFLQGIMGNYVDFVGKLIFNKFGQYEYFYDQMDWLKSVGVEYELLKIDTEETVKVNALVLEDAIERSTKPVLILSHSKGGIDTLTALTNRPSLQAKVKGVVFLQAPFYGTPVADYLQNIVVFDFLANFVLTILGGTGKALNNLSTYERMPWMQRWDPEVQSFLSKVRVLCFSTFKNDEPWRVDAEFEFSRNSLKKNRNVDSDGLVPWNSMILPNSRYVFFEGHDHASTVTNNRYIKLERARFFRALLRTLYSD